MPTASRPAPVAAFNCSFSWRSPVCASASRACTSASRCAIGADARLIGRQLGFERVHLVLIRRRIDPEEDVALLHRPVVLDRHLDHPSADLRHDRHDVLDDADVARRRREDVQQEQENGNRHHGEDRDGNLPRRRPRQQLQLDEDQPDEERRRCRAGGFPFTGASLSTTLASSASRSARSVFSSDAGTSPLEPGQPVAKALACGLIRRPVRAHSSARSLSVP